MLNQKRNQCHFSVNDFFRFINIYSVNEFAFILIQYSKLIKNFSLRNKEKYKRSKDLKHNIKQQIKLTFLSEWLFQSKYFIN